MRSEYHKAPHFISAALLSRPVFYLGAADFAALAPSKFLPEAEGAAAKGREIETLAEDHVLKETAG
jgi:hypothetical protein